MVEHLTLFGLTLPLVVWLFWLAITAYCLWQVRAQYQLLRWANITPTARIGSAAMGFVELAATTQLLEGEPILSPYTRIPCVWWRVEIEKIGSGQKGGAFRERSSDDVFALRDATGQCMVLPNNLAVYGAHKRVIDYLDANSASALLGTHTVGASTVLNELLGHLLPQEHYRCTEYFVPINASVLAWGRLGTLRNNNSYNSNLPDDVSANAVNTLLNEWKANPQKMKAFDTNNNGRIDANEWEAVRRMAIQQLQNQATSQPTVTNTTPASWPVLQKTNNSQPFVLLVDGEATLRGRRWAMWGYGLLLLGVSVAAIVFGLQLHNDLLKYASG